MAANSGDLVQSLIEGGLAPQAARILGNVLANANSPAFSKGQDEEDATPAAMLRLINSDARRYMLKNLDFSPSAPFQKQLESTVGQYAGPPPDHPYKNSQPVSSAAPLASPRIQAGDYVSVDTQVDGNAAVSKVGLRLRLQEGNHLRIDQSTKFLDAIRFAARTETPQFLAAEFVDSGPETQLLVSLRNLEKVTVVLSDGTQRDVFAFPDSAATPLPGTFMPGFSEGTWTPEFHLYTPSIGVQPTFTYDTNFTLGRYYRLGNWVHASARVKLTAKSGGTGTGSIGIKGLPFKVQFASAPFAGTVGFRANFTTGSDQAYAQDVSSIGSNGRNDMVILARTRNTSQTQLSNEMQATSDISISVVYRTDAP